MNETGKPDTSHGFITESVLSAFEFSRNPSGRKLMVTAIVTLIVGGLILGAFVADGTFTSGLATALMLWGGVILGVYLTSRRAEILIAKEKPQPGTEAPNA